MLKTGILFCALLTGCASMSAPQLSAEQQKAVSADKNVSATCVFFTGIWGTGKAVTLGVDQKVIINGSVAVDPNTCAVTMTNTATETKK